MLLPYHMASQSFVPTGPYTVHRIGDIALVIFDDMDDAERAALHCVGLRVGVWSIAMKLPTIPRLTVDTNVEESRLPRKRHAPDDAFEEQDAPLAKRVVVHLKDLKAHEVAEITHTVVTTPIVTHTR